MYSVHQIADELIKIANKNEGLISHLKLQKILYFAQGHYLAENNTPLFQEDIQAWAHGPVCPNVYKLYKHCSYENISKPEKSACFDGSVDSSLKNFLSKIWKAYGKFTGKALEELSHTQSPWKDTYQENVKGLIISQDKIKEYFKSEF